MNIALMIYLLGVVDNLKEFAVPIFAFGLVGTIVAIIIEIGCKLEEFGEPVKSVAMKARRLTVLVLAASALVMCFVPSSKTIAAMYLVPKIANNEQVQQIPSKALDVLNKKLDEWAGDLTEDK